MSNANISKCNDYIKTAKNVAPPLHWIPIFGIFNFFGVVRLSSDLQPPRLAVGVDVSGEQLEMIATSRSCSYTSLTTYHCSFTSISGAKFSRSSFPSVIIPLQIFVARMLILQWHILLQESYNLSLIVTVLLKLFPV